tara:strand:- start:1320 stop:1667 length:348 start_codon:yes stop_codon:yes gene_type:complete
MYRLQGIKSVKNHDLIAKLQAHLKLLYQRAIDADQQLEGLHQQGHGKFSAILNQPTLFSTQADRFQPYVFELAEKVSQLEKEMHQDQINLILRCMQELTLLLEQFKSMARTQAQA